MTTVTQLGKIIDAEEVACYDRVVARVRPLLVAEFKRAKERCPDLEKVLFGNGTCLLVFKESENVLANSILGDPPASCKRLHDLCYAVAYEYPVDDLTEKDLA